MIRRHSPDVFTYNKETRSRRVKSEIPSFFKDSSIRSLRQSESKNALSKAMESKTNASKSYLEDIVIKHREALLLILKVPLTLNDLILNKLKELTNYPDLLTDVIYKNLRGFKTAESTQNQYIEEISEYKKYTTTLQTQLIKAKQSNEELTNMLLSVKVQQQLNVIIS